MRRVTTSDHDRQGRPTAFVTGASRGIGKAIALSLAGVGYDVAVTARTVAAGETREHSSTQRRSDTRPLPGSLLETARQIEALGGRALCLPADLLDLDSVTAALASVIAQWGRVDVLVNNGRYVGPGHMDHFLQTPLPLVRSMFEANVFAPLALIGQVLPQMQANGSGLIVNVTSEVAYLDPPAPAGAGGWGLGYAMTKGAFQRIAGVLAREITTPGVRLFNVEPGFVATERTSIELADFGVDVADAATPQSVGEVVAWIATHAATAGPNGATFRVQGFDRSNPLTLEP
jgi:NAD(P)-dependent dehydrogenase (short-subunit alcohol dehydrogenase family)